MRRAILAVGLLALGSCAATLDGYDQQIAVTTDPSGAECVFEREGAAIGTIARTPGTLTVRRLKYDITIRCNKAGYDEARMLNKSGLSKRVAANIVSDVLLTGGLATIIDSATGADNEYATAINLILRPKGR